MVAGLLLGLGAVLAPGCSVEEEARPSKSQLQTTSNNTTCDPSQPGTCYQPTCCQIVKDSKCMAKVENSSSPRKTLRISQLRVQAPAKLASSLVQNTIVSPAVTQLDPECGFKDVNKGGLFNWLIDFDTSAKKLRTGGARAVEKIDEGYCFLKADFTGVQVEPILVDMNFDAGTGAFSTAAQIPRLAVPIFQKRDPKDIPILLPLRNVEIYDGVLDTNGNCIGRFRGESGELDGDCKTLTNDVTSPEAYLFENGGKIRGVITLEEANQVKIVDLNQTLCALLVKPNATEKQGDFTSCKQEGGKLAPEVFASADAESTPGGAKDAVKLAAEFAASSIKITDGECN